jgi:hypothetical protein
MLTNITIIFHGATIRLQQLSVEGTFAGLVTFVPQPKKGYRGFLSSKTLQLLSILEEESTTARLCASAFSHCSLVGA